MKLKISRFNPSSLSASIFVLLDQEGKKSLKTYFVSDFLLNSDEPSSTIENGIDNFIFDENNLIMVQVKNDMIKITNVELSDLSREVFTLKNETKLVKNFVKNKYVVLEFENLVGEIDIYILDLRNKRFL